MISETQCKNSFFLKPMINLYMKDAIFKERKLNSVRQRIKEKNMRFFFLLVDILDTR